MIAACLVAITATSLGQVPTVNFDGTVGGMTFPGRVASAGGVVYVTDLGESAVHEVSGGIVSATYSIPEAPVGIAIHPSNGKIYVSRMDGAVGIYDAAFALQGTLDPTPMTMVAPNDIAVHPNTGEVYVVDSGGHQVLVFSGFTDTLARAWGAEGSGLGEFRTPQAVAIDAALDHVLVADTDNFRVQVFDAAGLVQYKFGYKTLFASETVAWFARSEGIAVDDCSNVYVSDALMGTVRVFSSLGQELDPSFVPVLDFGVDPGDLEVPIDVAIDGGGMYVVSTGASALNTYSVACSTLKWTDEVIRTPETPEGKTIRRQTAPDNPVDIARAIDDGTYSRSYDLNNDRRVDLVDLEIAVGDFGAGTVDDILKLDDPIHIAPPHMIPGAPVICGRCHDMDAAPGGMLTDWGQENLCMSCHASSGIAMGDIVAGEFTTGVAGNDHPRGVMADSGAVTGPDPASAYEIGLHLDEGKIRCGTCHDPHDVGDGGYLRDPRPNAALCKQCHRGEGNVIDHAIGLEHGPEYCTDCHDVHADGDNAYLTKESMFSWYNGGMVAVGFTDDTVGVGDGGFVDPDAGEFGFCDVCHPYFDDSDPLNPVVSPDFLALTPVHDQNMPACTDCHKHENGFEPGLSLGLGSGTWVGADTCQICHPDTHADWMDTLHRDAWDNLEAAAAPPFFMPHENPACLPCHTVGFGDPTGFVDILATPELAGVQCENCHGSGADHVNLATAENITIDKSAELCGGCHTGSHHPTFPEWEESPHSDTAENSHGIPSCFVCHAPLGEQDGELLDVECVACHDSHMQTGNDAVPDPSGERDSQLLYPEVVNTVPSNDVDDVTNPDRYNLCGRCHHSRGREWTATSRGPHHSQQVNVLLGELPMPEGEENDPLVPPITSDHAVVVDQCTQCHMYTAPHEDGPPEVEAITGHTWHINYEACVDCHDTALDAESLALALQGEITARISTIEAALGDPSVWEYSCCGGPPEGPGGQDDITDEVKQVRFIVKFVEGDASLGAHNPDWIRAMLAWCETTLGLEVPQMFPQALHNTRQGKRTFFAAENGGMELLMPGHSPDTMGCTGCHAPNYADGTPVDPVTYVPSCRDCHVDPVNPSADPVGDSVCYGCHSRQGAESGGLGLPDVHRDAGMGCMDCHSIGDVHGDGNEYASQLEPGAIDANCETCHPEEDIMGSNEGHAIHMDTVHCTACHTSSVISCYNCHMESMINDHVKKFVGPPPRSGFKLLVNREKDGKIHTASFQSAVFDGQSFYVIAPYTSHSVVRDVDCDSCHGNAAITEFNDTGAITVATWDDVAKTLDGPTGVIPVPENFWTALQLDFVDYDPIGDVWNYLKTGPDLAQMMYATPLTVEQMGALAMSVLPEEKDFPDTVVTITDVNGGVAVQPGGAFTVDMTIEDDTGTPIPIGDLNRLQLYVSGPTENYQRVIDGETAGFVQNVDMSITFSGVLPGVYLAPENDSPAFTDDELTGLPLLDGTYTVLIESRQTFGSVRTTGDDTMDFVVDNDGVAPLPLAPREFVTQAACNACHNDLQLHGSNRKTVKGCAICHTAGAEDLITDPATTPGVSIELGPMIHMLHQGHGLASIGATENSADPYRYEIIGYRESVHDFSEVGFPIIPMGVMDCEACHGGAAQGADIYTNGAIGRRVCTGCHDDLDFTTGTILDESNPSVDDGLLLETELSDPAYRIWPGGGTADHTLPNDSLCSGCHGAGEDQAVYDMHRHPVELDTEGTGLGFDILTVSGMTGGGGTYFQAGDTPMIQFKMYDSANDPLALPITADSTVLDRAEVIIYGPTTQ
ncbi:MAG: multiheme c-type cytochrome, partial [Phycisphaerae bacterium]